LVNWEIVEISFAQGKAYQRIVNDDLSFPLIRSIVRLVHPAIPVPAVAAI